MTAIATRDADSGPLAVHPVAEFFPMMTGAEYDSFKEDIRAHGLLKPIEVDRTGQLIDGRNRLRACEELGIRVRTVVVDLDDLTSYIISCNLQRRQLNDGQRARVGEKIAQRNNMGGRGLVGHMADQSEVIPTQEEVAALLNVSVRQMGRARSITKHGTEELNELVDEGSVPLRTAETVSKVAPDMQRAFVQQVRQGVNPVRIAPKDDHAPVVRPKSAPRHGPRRKHLEVLINAATSLSGLVMVLDEIATLDDSVGNEEAARLKGGFSKAITGLNRINNLLKERIASD